jgi:hypothetical protein
MPVNQSILEVGFFITFRRAIILLMVRDGIIPKILLISFAVVAVFGFWLMTHDQMMGSGSCVANTVQGSMCAQIDPFAFAGFHISAFNSFTSVTMQNLAVFSLIVFVLITVVGLLGILNAILPVNYSLKLYFDSQSELRSKYKFRNISWFSLNENSPTLV